MDRSTFGWTWNPLLKWNLGCALAAQACRLQAFSRGGRREDHYRQWSAVKRRHRRNPPERFGRGCRGVPALAVIKSVVGADCYS